MYHVAKLEFNEGDVLKTNAPSVPIKEEGDIPRICISNNPLKCILALHPIVNKGKVYSKTYTALYSWLYDRFCYKQNIAMKKMKDTFKIYETKFPHGNVTLLNYSSAVDAVVFRYKDISISEIKLLIRIFRQYYWSVKFIREDNEKIFRSFIIRNVQLLQLLEVMDKSYLPPNASNFRKFGER